MPCSTRGSMRRVAVRAILSLFCLLAAFAMPAALAAPPERIYLACDDHTDYYWSADAAAYRQAFVEMLDHYLARADATADEPDDFQARFNCDGSLWVWEYERNRPAADFARLMRRIQDGHISVPLTPITLCYGAMPAEAVLRSMYYAGRIQRRYGLALPTVQPMEDQTMPFGVGSLFAGAGAKYCWMGICSCASRVPDNAAPRAHEIYWWTGRDGRRLLIKWNSLHGNASLGGYAEARQPARAVEYLDRDPGYAARWKYPLVKAAFGKGHDDLRTLTDDFETVAREKSTTGRRVRNSNEIDFFQDFEATYGAQIPAYSAAFGNEWDLYPASMAEVSARVKRAIERLRAAEALAVLVSLQDPQFMTAREAARDQAMLNIGLYFNHDWTGDGPVSRETLRDWAKSLAAQIEAYVGDLERDAAAALGERIGTGGSQARFFVFNPLSWKRTEAADLPSPDAGPVHVIDLATGQQTPVQRVTRDGQPYLRVLAVDVPSVGYKVFEVRPGQGKDFPDAAIARDGELENSVYRLTIDGRGAITSLIDKARGDRQFVRTIRGRAINDLGDGTGTVEVESCGPVSVTLRATSSMPLAHTTRVTLYRDSRRIEIDNEITQNFHSTGDRPPRWAFSFNLDSPDVWHEEVGAVIRAKLLADGGHYAPDHARYDWQTLSHFADINGEGTGVTLSNADCLFMKVGDSSVTSLDTASPQLSVLAGGMVDGERLGIHHQGGDRYFRQRFALQTHAGWDEAQAMKFALAHQNPLVTGRITGQRPVYPETEHGLLTISDPQVLMWSLKPAEDGIEQAGIALRVWNLGAAPARFTATLAGVRILAARQATHIETPTADAAVDNGVLTAPAAAHALETYLLVPELPQQPTK